MFQTGFGGPSAMFRQPQVPVRPGPQEPRKVPEPPVSPYIRFCRRHWQSVRSDNANLQLWEVSTVVKDNWDKLTEAQRSPYQHEYDCELAEYEKICRQINGTSAVQTAIKNRVKGSKSKGAEPGTSALIRASTEDEDQQPSELTARRMHALRFDRNHRLVADLFNSTAVFDSRLVVPQKRLDLLQKQATNLDIHKTKLEEELTKLEEAFAEKKRHLQRSSEEFNEKLKKVVESKVSVSDEGYEELVVSWEGKLAAAYEEYKVKQEEQDKHLAAEREKLAKTTPLLYAMTMGDEDPEKTGKSETLPVIEAIPPPAPVEDTMEVDQKEQAESSPRTSTESVETAAKETPIEQKGDGESDVVDSAPASTE